MLGVAHQRSSDSSVLVGRAIMSTERGKTDVRDVWNHSCIESICRAGAAQSTMTCSGITPASSGLWEMSNTFTPNIFWM